MKKVSQDKKLMEKTVIVITDGDKTAYNTVCKAANTIGACVIEQTAGNPTPIPAELIIEKIRNENRDTIIVLADDAGQIKIGAGSRAIDILITQGILAAAVAVASNTPVNEGVEVNLSILKNGKVKHKGVDKYGRPKKDSFVYGDTVEELNKAKVPVVGIGDAGKAPRREKGVEVMIMAIKLAKKLALAKTSTNVKKTS